MDAAYLPHYTMEDWRRWEGDWELIEGVPYAMAPSPGVTHRSVGVKIVRQLDEALEACPEYMVVYETDWEVSSDTVIRPDCMVICGQAGERVRRAPRILFEIVSPQSVIRDEHLKFEIAEREGVPYYVLVYPGGRVAKVFQWREGRYVKAADCTSETFEFGLEACAVGVDFSRVWPRVEVQPGG